MGTQYEYLSVTEQGRRGFQGVWRNAMFQTKQGRVKSNQPKTRLRMLPP